MSVVLIAAAVWFGGKAERSAGDQGEEQVRAAQAMLIARLDLETGLRGYLLTGRSQFLQPYLSGLAAYRQQATQLAAAIGSGSRQGRLLAQENRLTRSWVRQARQAIAMRQAGEPVSAAQLRRRKAEMDRFRQANAALVAEAEAHRRNLQDRANEILLGIIGLLVLLAAVSGYLLIERPATRRKRERAEQQEFAETLQFARGEREAQGLLCRELGRAIPGGSALVFSRNNSENRLQTPNDLSEHPALAERMEAAAPADCLAVRRGREVERRTEDSRLFECELCGAIATNSVCQPLLVGGEVIGSVLVGRDSKPLSRRERRRLESTVASAGPVLANLRNLAIAETRAVTDALTGLSNARAAAQDLERITAFAARTGTPLVAILLDLDHFKRINDSFGHQIGDETLAAVGAALRGGTRASDFVARYGGEEFLILLQDTDLASGVALAESLREGLRQTQVPGLAGRVTASFGVASMPEHARDAESLLRAADRALYAAKKGGRDRVCTADQAGGNGSVGAAAEPGMPVAGREVGAGG
ncbi:MAG TPA: diguanylate cyclase [Solirubrobacterales bacterium]